MVSPHEGSERGHHPGVQSGHKKEPGRGMPSAGRKEVNRPSRLKGDKAAAVTRA
jgi:hypothetical protein